MQCPLGGRTEIIFFGAIATFTPPLVFKGYREETGDEGDILRGEGDGRDPAPSRTHPQRG